MNNSLSTVSDLYEAALRGDLDVLGNRFKILLTLIIDGPQTASQIHSTLNNEHSSVSRTTVHRALNGLVDADIVCPDHRATDADLYRIADDDSDS